MRWMWACALGVALSACGGGGGDSGTPVTPPPASGGSTGVNGTLEGKLMYRDGASVVLLDLMTGARASLPLQFDF